MQEHQERQKIAEEEREAAAQAAAQAAANSAAAAAAAAAAGEPVNPGSVSSPSRHVNKVSKLDASLQADHLCCVELKMLLIALLSMFWLTITKHPFNFSCPNAAQMHAAFRAVTMQPSCLQKLSFGSVLASLTN